MLDKVETTLVCAVDGSTGYVGGYNYVVVPLTMAVLGTLVSRVTLLQSSYLADPHLCSMEFSCYDHGFTGTFDLGEKEWVTDDSLVIDADKLSRIECPRLHLQLRAEASGPPSVRISFTGIPKHTDITVSSVEIDSGELFRHLAKYI